MQLFSPLMEENLIQTVVLLPGQLNQGYQAISVQEKKATNTIDGLFHYVIASLTSLFRAIAL